MYMAVIIGVDAMVYTVCKRGRQFNPSPLHIKGLVSQSLEVFLKKIDVCRVHIDFAKIQEVLRESNVGRVLVDFTQIQSFFKKKCQSDTCRLFAVECGEERRRQ